MTAKLISDVSHPVGAEAPTGRSDAVPLLMLFVVLLFALPTQLVVGALGAAGSPASLLSILLFVWWLLSRLVPTLRLPDRSLPIRAALLVFSVTALTGYLSGMTRAITSEEVSSSDRGLLTFVGWVGVTLVTAEGMRSRASLDRLLKAVVIAGTCMAAVGMLQFFTGLNPAAAIRVPGLQFNQDFGSTVVRSGFNRVQATSGHPIEFGVVLALVLPLALHYAWFAPLGRRKRWWAAALLIMIALPMTVARSAILGAAVVGLVLLVSWEPARRRKALIAIPLLIIALRLAMPGLLGTIRSLFVNLVDDPSTQGRTQDYEGISYYLAGDPVTGRGLSTFIPSIYRTLDNAYLGWVIETGLLGLTSLLIVMVTGVVCAVTVRARAHDHRTRDLAACLGASLSSAVLTFGTFDAFGFAMCAGVYFLLIGAAGALLRLTPPVAAPATRLPGPAPTIRLRRVTAAAGALAALFLCTVLAAGWMVLNPRPLYWAEAVVSLRSQPGEGVNPYALQRDLDAQSQLGQRVVDSRSFRDRLAARGDYGQFTTALGDASLAAHTERQGNGPLLRIRGSASSAREALATRDAVVTELVEAVERMQVAGGSPPAEMYRVEIISAPDGAGYVTGRLSRAGVAVALLLALTGLPAAMAASTAMRARRERAAPGRGRTITGSNGAR